MGPIRQGLTAAPGGIGTRRRLPLFLVFPAQDGLRRLDFRIPYPFFDVLQDGIVHVPWIFSLKWAYWNDKKKEWNKDLFTQPLICHVDNDFVEKHRTRCIVIDALPKEYYDKKHIKGAFNLPYNKTITETIMKKIAKAKKMKESNKQVPIIVYCYNKDCDASEKLIKKLNKLGYYNIVEFENGIRGWKGETESSK